MPSLDAFYCDNHHLSASVEKKSICPKNTESEKHFCYNLIPKIFTYFLIIRLRTTYIGKRSISFWRTTESEWLRSQSIIRKIFRYFLINDQTYAITNEIHIFNMKTFRKCSNLKFCVKLRNYHKLIIFLLFRESLWWYFHAKN